MEESFILVDRNVAACLKARGAAQSPPDTSRCLRFACDPSITEKQGQEANLGYRWRLKSADSVSNKTKQTPP